MYCEDIETISDHCDSGLHKVKSWLLEAAEQDKNKTHSENNGDIYSSDKMYVGGLS